MKAIFLIVIYNKEIALSPLFEKIKRETDFIRIIFDNSTDEKLRNKNEQFCIKNNVNYYTLKKNVGLSKAYNYSFEQITKEKLDFNYLILCDDDTSFLNGYFKELENIDLSENIGVYAPKVYGDKRNNLIFPKTSNKYKIFLNTRYDDKDIKHIYSINSGLCIHKNIVNKYRFDEKYFLYMIDWVFLEDMTKLNTKFKVMDSKVIQTFFEHEKNFNENSTLIQMKIRLLDTKEYTNFFNYTLFKNYYIIKNVIFRKNLKIFKLYKEC